jgi:hypothetical protein
LALISAFLAAGIDNVSTLLFRDETFCNQREIKSGLNNNYSIAMEIMSITQRNRQKASNQQINMLQG